jgi:tyrosyl-tRNA synthetase
MNFEENFIKIKQNAVHIIDENDLIERLKTGKPLKVKFGVDPTRPDLTFGHLGVFQKLRVFQELGHEAILLIGDYTTLIGDPSGRSSTRPVLTHEEIAKNTETYLEQAFKVLDRTKTTVRYNSEWFKKQSFEDCLQLARKMTVAQILEREDFGNRYKSGNPISMVEFLYPLLQGHDSVELEADIELGGTDQLFNLMVGRTLQQQAGQKPQIVMTSPLLVGLDGEKKMSKSLGNYIAFNDSSKNMFGKILSIPDAAMADYYRLLLLEDEDFLKALPEMHPMEAKKQLAIRLVEQFFDKEIALAERLAFENVFSSKQLPETMPEFNWAALANGQSEMAITDLLMATQLFQSKKEIRRIAEQGGLRLNGEPIPNPNISLKCPPTGEPYVFNSGKRLFFKILQ